MDNWYFEDFKKTLREARVAWIRGNKVLKKKILQEHKIPNRIEWWKRIDERIGIVRKP